MRLLTMMMVGLFLCAGNLRAEMGDGEFWENVHGWNDAAPGESIQEAEKS